MKATVHEIKHTYNQCQSRTSLLAPGDWQKEESWIVSGQQSPAGHLEVSDSRSDILTLLELPNGVSEFLER